MELTSILKSRRRHQPPPNPPPQCCCQPRLSATGQSVWRLVVHFQASTGAPWRRDLGVRPGLMNCVARVPDPGLKTRSNQRVQLRWEPVIFLDVICRPEPEVELTDISGQRVLIQGKGDIGFAIGEGVCQRRRELAEMPPSPLIGLLPSCRTCS